MSEDPSIKLKQATINTATVQNQLARIENDFDQSDGFSAAPKTTNSSMGEMFSASIQAVSWQVRTNYEMVEKDTGKKDENDKPIMATVAQGYLEIYTPIVYSNGSRVPNSNIKLGDTGSPPSVTDGWNRIDMDLPLTDKGGQIVARFKMDVTTAYGKQTKTLSEVQIVFVEVGEATPEDKKDEETGETVATYFDIAICHVVADATVPIEQIHTGILTFTGETVEEEEEIRPPAWRVVPEGFGWKILSPTWFVNSRGTEQTVGTGDTATTEWKHIIHEDELIEDGATIDESCTLYAVARVTYSKDTLLAELSQISYYHSIGLEGTENKEVQPQIAGGTGVTDDGVYHFCYPIGTFNVSTVGEGAGAATIAEFTQLHEGAVFVQIPERIGVFVPGPNVSDVVKETWEEGEGDDAVECEANYDVQYWNVHYTYPDLRGLVMTNVINKNFDPNTSGGAAPNETYASKILVTAQEIPEVEIPTCAWRVVKDGESWKVLRPAWVVGSTTHTLPDQTLTGIIEGGTMVYARAKLVYSHTDFALVGPTESTTDGNKTQFSVATSAEGETPKSTQIVISGTGTKTDGKYYIDIPIGMFIEQNSEIVFQQRHEGAVFLDAPPRICELYPSSANIEAPTTGVDSGKKFLTHKWWAYYNYPDTRGFTSEIVENKYINTGSDQPTPNKEYHSKVELPATAEVSASTCAWQVVKGDGASWNIINPVWVISGRTVKVLSEGKRTVTPTTNDIGEILYAHATIRYSETNLQILLGDGTTDDLHSSFDREIRKENDFTANSEIVFSGTGSTSRGVYHFYTPIAKVVAEGTGVTLEQIHEGAILLDLPQYIASFVPSSASIVTENEKKYFTQQWWAVYNYPDTRGLIKTTTVSNILFNSDNSSSIPNRTYHSKVELPASGETVDPNEYAVGTVTDDSGVTWLVQGNNVDGTITQSKILNLSSLAYQTQLQASGDGFASGESTYSVARRTGTASGVGFGTQTAFNYSNANGKEADVTLLVQNTIQYIYGLNVVTPTDETSAGEFCGTACCALILVPSGQTNYTKSAGETVYFYTEVVNANAVNVVDTIYE